MHFLCLFLFLSMLTPAAYAQEPEVTHGIAMYDSPKYPADFTHFDTVNPQAPKGGTLRLSAIGTFDTLNPFVTKGIPASSLGLIYSTLMVNSPDEAFSKYGGLAQEIIVPEDRSSLTIRLHPNAQWHDGKPVTAQDVVWSFNTLMELGSPFYKAYWADVETVTATREKEVMFDFTEGVQNLELPLILGQLPVLPEHYWEGRDFTATTLEQPLGSGPYKIASLTPGRSITYERVAQWWGEDVPAYKGQYNFDRIEVDYYRDPTVAMEAFLANEYDFRQEYIAKSWATAYKGDAVEAGEIILDQVAHEQPAGMQAFIMNIRDGIFADRDVRRAMQYVFDFEWSNKQFAFSSYTRTDSFFENSELASSGLPQGEELSILESFRDQLPEEIFTQEFVVPVTQGNGHNRAHLAKAIAILEAAGYRIGPDSIRVHPETGERLSFTIIDNQAAFERWVLPMIQNLRRVGIEAKFEVVDNVQLVNRLNEFDFDMTIHSFGQSNSPGNEQREFWHSNKSTVAGSRNLVGIADPVIDELIELVINAPDRDSLVQRTRALDRVLLHGYYVIPQWHINAWRLAYWDRFERPENPSKQVMDAVTSWWAKTP